MPVETGYESDDPWDDKSRSIDWWREASVVLDSASSSPVRSNSTLTGTPLAGPSNSLRAQRPSIEKKSSKKPRESGASEDFWEHEPHGDGFWEEACRIADSVSSSPTRTSNSSQDTPLASLTKKLELVKEKPPASPTWQPLQQDRIDKRKAKRAYRDASEDFNSDAEMREVEDMIGTDTDSSAPSTRPASFFMDSKSTSMSSIGSSQSTYVLNRPSSFFANSTSTSMTSIMSESPSSNRKRTWDDPGAHSLSPPPSPPSPKIRKMVGLRPPVPQPVFDKASPVTVKSPAPPKRLSSHPERSPARAPNTGPGSTTTTKISIFPPPSDIPDQFNPPSVPRSRSPARDVLVSSATWPTIKNTSYFSVSPDPPSRSPVLQPAEARTTAALPIISRSYPKPPVPPELSGALQKPLGINLQPIIIAHSKEKQALIDKLPISWGVQYEIARGVSRNWWKWEDVTEAKLKELIGPAAHSAPRVRSVILSHAPSTGATDNAIWLELDREQAAIEENEFRGLGLMDDWLGVADWYGGQIQQIARIEPSDNPAIPYVVRLEELEKRRSNRLARFLGSRRIVQLRVSDKLLRKDGDKIREFVRAKFIICGRVFVPLHAKDNGVYMVETNEDFERRPDQSCGDLHRMSFQKVIQWLNPLELNFDQPISKWSTRFALALSTSIPVLEFEADKIFYIKDIVVDDDDTADGKPPAEKNMTDGCGFMNGAALTQIMHRSKQDGRPTAVQGRIAGSKGLWILHPFDRDPTAPPRIWIRDSQKKIHLGVLDRAHRIFDLVAVARVSSSHRLSMQSIVNLSHNNVPDSVFVSLMAQGLEDEVSQLTDWTSPASRWALWKAIHRAGGVAGMRMSRHAVGVTRAIGLTGREFGSDDDLDDADDIVAGPISEPIVSMGRNRYSGAPVSMHESALELVQAGFSPLESKFLADKIRAILRLVVESYVKEYRISIPQSIDAFMVPDPYGVLNEGEIFFQSSKPLEHPQTGAVFHVVEGDVLIGRYPLRLASDIQKVSAVNRHLLSEYHDVIVVPMKGMRSLPSLLSGGDVDGDAPFLIWDPALVVPFQNSELVEAAPNFISYNFEKRVIGVSDFFNQPHTQTAHEEEFQKVLLHGLSDTKVGMYSNYHDLSVYIHGYAHPKSVHYAYMFTTLLDSSKTGLRVKSKVMKADGSISIYSRPECMQPAQHEDSGGKVPADRHPLLGQFVLQSLLEAGEVQKARHLKAYDELEEDIRRQTTTKDPDLCKPLIEAREKAEAAAQHGFHHLTNELDDILLHVRNVRDSWGMAGSKESSPQKQSPKKRGKSSSSKLKDNPYGALAKDFAEGPAGIQFTTNVDEIKAAYAYDAERSNQPERFAFCVAFKHLAAIKARAKGPSPMTIPFSESMAISGSYLKAMAAAQESVDP